MFVKNVEKLFFYFSISCAIYYITIRINFWKILSTHNNQFIKNDQKNINHVFKYLNTKTKSKIVSNNLAKDFNYDIQHFPIYKKFDDLYFDESIYYRKKRKVMRDLNKKWIFPIVYEIEKDKFNETLINEVLQTIENETCIRFAKRNATNKSYQTVLKYFLGTTCVSYYGRQRLKDVQGIFLTKACQNWRNVIHETFHALGLIHEQARYDRDNYVTINWGNIIRGCEKNFNKINSVLTSTYNLSYDYGSVMHYYPYSWGINNAITIAPKDDIYLSTLGSSDTANFNDFKALNLHYCQNQCSKSIKCKNFAYQNPNNCKVCKCPDGFQGTLCRVKSKGKDNCGTIRTASNSIGKIKISGSKSCTFHIIAKGNKKIDIYLSNITFPTSLVCKANNCLEIKYKKDVSITGARICKKLYNYTLKSEASKVVILYKSTNAENSASILFRIYKKSNLPWNRIKKKRVSSAL
uniref:Zinc metalloproteinase n=1 Tax=Strongyloides papillosus TaxID=174720 RepID=A0A0N5CC21_STREA